MTKRYKTKKFRRINGGFTLVETLVAVSIFTMSILGLMSVLASGISNTNYAKEKIIASYLAQEGIEYIRNMRDTEVLYGSGNGNARWNKFKSDLNSCNNDTDHACGLKKPLPFGIFQCSASIVNEKCNLYMNDGGYDNISSGADSGFVRKIWLTTSGGDEVKIYSEVEWTQGSGNYSITFSENLFNWIE